MSSIEQSSDLGRENAFYHANGDHDPQRVLAEFLLGGVPGESLGTDQNLNVAKDIADGRKNIFQTLSHGMAGFLRRG